MLRMQLRIRRKNSLVDVDVDRFEICGGNLRRRPLPPRSQLPHTLQLQLREAQMPRNHGKSFVAPRDAHGNVSLDVDIVIDMR